MRFLRLIVLLISSPLLHACTETSSTQPAPQLSSAPVPAMRDASPQDEQACLTAVAKQANNSVVVLSSEFSQANSLVMVGVGPQKAPWKCLVSKGTVAEVMSMTNEGSL